MNGFDLGYSGGSAGAMGRQTQGFLDVMGLGGGGSVSPSEGKQGKLPPGVTNPHDESLYGNGKALIFEIIKDIVVGIITSVLYDKWKEPPPIQPDNSNHTIGDSPSGGVPDPAPTPAPPTPPPPNSACVRQHDHWGWRRWRRCRLLFSKTSRGEAHVQ